MWRLFSFYAPAWLSILYVTILFFMTSNQLNLLTTLRSGSSGRRIQTHDSQRDNAISKVQRQLKWYPLVLLLSWTGSTIFRARETFDKNVQLNSNSRSFFEVVFANGSFLQACGHVLVYGYTPMVRRLWYRRWVKQGSNCEQIRRTFCCQVFLLLCCCCCACDEEDVDTSSAPDVDQAESEDAYDTEQPSSRLPGLSMSSSWTASHTSGAGTHSTHLISDFHDASGTSFGTARDSSDTTGIRLTNITSSMSGNSHGAQTTMTTLSSESSESTPNSAMSHSPFHAQRTPV